MRDFIVRDARRAARQIARLARDWPRPTGAAAAVWALTLTAGAYTRTWAAVTAAAAAAAAVWAATLWSRHMRRPRFRAACHAAKLDHPPHLTPGTITREPYGWRARVTLKPEHNIDQLTSRAGTLQSNLGVRSVTIEPDPDDHGHATIDVVERLPWPDGLIRWPHADDHTLSVWEPCPVAVDLRLTPITFRLAVPGWGGGTGLAGGVQGSGKSTALHLPTATAALDPTCQLAIFDGKVSEHHAWQHAATRFVGFDIHEAIDALEWIQRWVNLRLEALADEGRRLCRPGDPMLYWLCDEWATYTHHPDRKAADRFVALALSSVQRGRAAGLIAWFGAQKPSHDTVPTSTRDLLDNRAGFRANTKAASDMVNGEGMAAEGYDSRDIGRDQPGVAWWTTRGQLRLGKGYALTDGDIDDIAGRATTPPPRPAPATAPPAHTNGNGHRRNGDQPIDLMR